MTDKPPAMPELPRAQEIVGSYKKWFTADQMRARDAMWAERIAALQPQPAAAVSDAEIERVFQSCGGKWDGDMWVIEDADFHPTIRAILALRPQAVPMTPEQVRAVMTEAGYDDAKAQARADFISGIRHAEQHHRIGITQRADGGEG